MRQIEKREHRYTTDVCVWVKCDLCGSKDPVARNDQGGAIVWDSDNYHVSKTTVALEDYDSYPDGCDDGEKLHCDICPECFRTKLIPWLESQGAVIGKTEADS